MTQSWCLRCCPQLLLFLHWRTGRHAFNRWWFFTRSVHDVLKILHQSLLMLFIFKVTSKHWKASKMLHFNFATSALDHSWHDAPINTNPFFRELILRRGLIYLWNIFKYNVSIQLPLRRRNCKKFRCFRNINEKQVFSFFDRSYFPCIGLYFLCWM